MARNVDNLADQVASLDEPEQEALLERVAELNFKRGLNALSHRYQKRLENRGELNKKSEDILADLRSIREDIASREYQML